MGDKYVRMSIMDTNEGEVLFYTKIGDSRDPGIKLFPPKTLRRRLMTLPHTAHGAKEGQYETAQGIWWWADMKNYIETHNRKSKTAREPVFPLDVFSYKSGHYWSANLFQVQEVKKKEPTSYLIITDNTSGLMLARRIPNTKTAAVVKSITEVMCTIGIPTIVRSDAALL